MSAYTHVLNTSLLTMDCLLQLYALCSDQVNAIEPESRTLSDDELHNKTEDTEDCKV